MGNGAVQHTEVITTADIKKIGEMQCTTPELLQLKVWFSLQYHFAKRGMENSHEMEKGDVIISVDPRGYKFLKLSDKITKNHRGNSTQESYGGIMKGTGDDKCPVTLVEIYLSHLCEANKFLWQRPKPVFSKDQASFCDMKIGINKMRGFMKQLSQSLVLSREYTNHCIRATAITILGESFQDTDVAAVSGHKSLTNLTIYKRTSNETKSLMSTKLHNAFVGQSSSSSMIPLEPKNDDCPSSSHSECCISYGAHSSSNMLLTKDIPFVLPLTTDSIDVDEIEKFVQNFDDENFVEGTLSTVNDGNAAEFPTKSESEENENIKVLDQDDIGIISSPVLQSSHEIRSVKNKLLKISDKAFVINGAGCAITFNVNITK